MDASPEDVLAGFGFTALETRIYVALLETSPQTGYALAKRLGKAPANVYQSLAGLAQKGAVVLEEGQTRAARATPPAELLAGLTRRFEAQRQQAAESLARIATRAPQDRLYQVQTLQHLFDKAESMLEGARETVLFDLFPGPMETLDAALRRAVDRGVRVSGIAYAEVARPYATVSAPRPGDSMSRWPGQQLTLVVDAREFLLALVSADGRSVVHGLWSDSVYLSCIQHNGLASEIALGALAGGATADDALAGSLLSTLPPGLRQLTASSRRNPTP